MALARRVASTLVTALCAGVLLWASPGIADDIEQLRNNQPIKIRSESILFDRDKPRKTRFGKLEWLGTLRLTSPSPYFGGYSGLVLDNTGTALLAVSDNGVWLSAKLSYRGGRMEKLTDARIGALHGIDKKNLTRKNLRGL